MNWLTRMLTRFTEERGQMSRSASQSSGPPASPPASPPSGTPEFGDRQPDAETETRAYYVDNISAKDPYMVMLFGAGTKTKAGQYVGPEDALHLAPFFSAISLIARCIASMPWGIMLINHYDPETDDDDSAAKRRNDDHYLNELMHLRPCGLFTPYTFKEWIIWNAILKGNAYIHIDKDKDKGFVTGLWPLEPDNVEPKLDESGNKIYKFTQRLGDDQSPIRIFDDDEIIHIPGFKYNGLKGQGVLDFARESVGLGLATEEFGARFFSGDGMATGIITHPARLSMEAKMNIKEGHKNQSKGMETASNSMGRGTAVLDEGMTYTRTGLSPEEGQFLGTRQYTVEEVCRWFNIPPFMMAVGTTASSLSAEEQLNYFVTMGLGPWMIKMNQESDIKLLNKNDRKKWRTDFDRDAISLMTMDKLLDSMSKGRNMGLYTLNYIARRTRGPLTKNAAGNQRIVPSTMKVMGDTDPSTPVPPQTITAFVDMVYKDRNATMESALALARLMMPSADEKDVKKIIEPLLQGTGNANQRPPDERSPNGLPGGNSGNQNRG